MTQDRPIGPVVEGWSAPPIPANVTLEGRHVRLEPMQAERHAAVLFAGLEGQDWLWDYMSVGPFASAAQFHRWMRGAEAGSDPFFLAIIDRESNACVGVASWLRIDPVNGAIEVGNIMFAPGLQRSPAATEAMVLMMGWAFGQGYRRYEWKCNALNLPSRRAAQRLGFSFEGVFRQHMIVKGRNRDTAWFAITDAEWPPLKEAYAAWLDPANFDEAGTQRESLKDLTRLVRVSSDPAI